MRILLSLFIAGLAGLALFRYTQTPDETITISVPKGYSPPVAMGERSWQDHLSQIMAQSIEGEAVAAPAEVKPAPVLQVKAANEKRVGKHTGRRAKHARRQMGRTRRR